MTGKCMSMGYSKIVMAHSTFTKFLLDTKAITGSTTTVWKIKFPINVTRCRSHAR